MSKIKITMSELERQDQVRLLEMTVESITSQAAVSVQFWKDVRLYGVDEARRYLETYEPNADFTELDELIERIRNEIVHP